MGTITTIIASQVGLLVTLFYFIWRSDKRSEERTNTASERLETQFQTLFAVLQNGQTHLQEGQTQILARVGKLEEGQIQLLIRMGNLETRIGKLEEGQATLAIVLAKAEIRLRHLEENAVTTQGKIDEISELSHQTNTKTANLDGLIRGYLFREHGTLHEAAAG